MSRRLLLVLAFATCGALACDTGDGGVDRPSVPVEDDFQPVGDMLHARCGSLDCHGQEGRSLKIYGVNGLRYSKDDHTGEGMTTSDEYDLDYQAVVSIEPEILSVVFHEHASPERLTMVRKARGTEAHKGNTVIAEGSDADVCLTSWLMGNPVDMAICASGATFVSPLPPP